MMTTDIEPLSIWTVYQNPSDYPGKFVARRSEITRDITHTNDMFVANTLEEIRALLPVGLHRIERYQLDDPVIVECWV
jgi:hypothetical protein